MRAGGRHELEIRTLPGMREAREGGRQRVPVLRCWRVVRESACRADGCGSAVALGPLRGERGERGSRDDRLLLELLSHGRRPWGNGGRDVERDWVGPAPVRRRGTP